VLLQGAAAADDRGWGLREAYTMTLLPFHELNQEKKFFSGGDERRLEAIPTMVVVILGYKYPLSREGL
jgi:hypothetical protein